MYLKSSRDYYAFLEGIPKDTDYRKGLEAAGNEAKKLVIEADHAEKVDRNYKYAFNVGYYLMKGDPKSYDQFVKNLKHKDDSLWKGYVAGGRQAALERAKERIKSVYQKKRDLGLDYDK